MLTNLYNRLCGQQGNIIFGCFLITFGLYAYTAVVFDPKVGNENRIMEEGRFVNKIRKIVLDVLIDKKLITNSAGF